MAQWQVCCPMGYRFESPLGMSVFVCLGPGIRTCTSWAIREQNLFHWTEDALFFIDFIYLNYSYNQTLHFLCIISFIKTLYGFEWNLNEFYHFLNDYHSWQNNEAFLIKVCSVAPLRNTRPSISLPFTIYLFCRDVNKNHLKKTVMKRSKFRIQHQSTAIAPNI